MLYGNLLTWFSFYAFVYIDLKVGNMVLKSQALLSILVLQLKCDVCKILKLAKYINANCLSRTLNLKFPSTQPGSEMRKTLYTKENCFPIKWWPFTLIARKIYNLTALVSHCIVVGYPKSLLLSLSLER